MSETTTRREALKAGLTAVVGAAVAGSTSIGNSPAAARSQSAHPVAQAFVTDPSDRRHTRCDAVLNGAGDAPVAVFSIDTRQPLQPILGFGAAFTEAACEVIGRLHSGDRAALLDEILSPSKSNFSIARICVGASDYSTKLYSYDEGPPDPTLSRFSINPDRAAVLPLLKQARAVRPDLFLLASPWSPPGWMKYGDSMLGGSIRPRYLGVYAQYICRYLQAYAEAGVTIDAMTIQNEVDADQNGRMPACAWPEETESRYVVDHLGPLLADGGVGPKIWVLDHNYNLSGRVLDQLADVQYRKFVHGVAWHGYAGTPDQMLAVQKLHPDIETHWTEGGDDHHSKTLPSNFARWGRQFADILNSGSRSIITWNLALDETGGPNIGPFRCAGLVTIDSTSKAVTRNGIFWALSHYSKAFERGSRVVRTEPMSAGHTTAAAAIRPDGSLAIVVSHGGPGATVRLDIFCGDGKPRNQRVDVSENSVTTILI